MKVNVYIYLYHLFSLCSFKRQLEEDSSLASSVPSVPVRARSDKQRPSRRKLRRWGNDKFIGIAAELSKAGHVNIAEEFSRGEAETSLYIHANDPRCYRSVFADMLSDETGELNDIKRVFVNGHVASSSFRNNAPGNGGRSRRKISMNGDENFNLLDPRLKRIVERMVTTKASSFATQLVNSYESYLQSIFCFKKEGETKLFNSYLICPPCALFRENGVIDVRFSFESNSPYGGINRLLLHAICQFHGLVSTSNTIKGKRILYVSGSFFGENLSLTHFAKRSFEKPLSVISDDDTHGENTEQRSDDLVPSISRMVIA